MVTCSIVTDGKPVKTKMLFKLQVETNEWKKEQNFRMPFNDLLLLEDRCDDVDNGKWKFIIRTHTLFSKNHKSMSES